MKATTSLTCSGAKLAAGVVVCGTPDLSTPAIAEPSLSWRTIVDRIRFGAFAVPVALAAWHEPHDATKSGWPRFTLAGSGTVVHAHHQRAFGATSRGAPACAPRPGPA